MEELIAERDKLEVVINDLSEVWKEEMKKKALEENEVDDNKKDDDILETRENFTTETNKRLEAMKRSDTLSASPTSSCIYLGLLLFYFSLSVFLLIKFIIDLQGVPEKLILDAMKETDLETNLKERVVVPSYKINLFPTVADNPRFKSDRLNDAYDNDFSYNENKRIRYNEVLKRWVTLTPNLVKKK